MNGQSNQKQRLCDYCDGSTALLYCRADSAKLCLSCDREVHSTSPLFVKHSRSQLCDACDEAPASVFCETERWVLCQNCDWETHKPSLSPPHNRRPIEGFSGCPSVSELLGFVGFEDLGNKALASGEEKLGSGVAGDTSFDSGFDGLLDLFVCETPTVASLDDLIVLNGSNHGLQATDIPPLPKDRNVTCGQYKEEILCQLRELAKTEPNLNNENTSIEANMQSLIPDCYLQPKDIYGRHEHDVVPISLRAYEYFVEDRNVNQSPLKQSSAFKGFGDSIEVADSVFPSPFPSSSLEENAMVPDKHINIGCQSSHQISSQDDQSQDHVATGTSSGVRKVPLYDMNSQERETAISRYKEKKRTRRYEKRIRYESRKLRAESRTRIRGRFAKVEP